MDRSPRFHAWTLLVLISICGFVCLQAGCNAIATAMYVIQGTNVDAEYDGLKGKRVAVVCRPVVELKYSSTNSSDEIASQVSQLLKKNVRKIKIVDPREVRDWTDSNSWQDFGEIGEALDADMVVGINLEQFELYEGQTLYKGQAKIHIEVVDVKDGNSIAYERHLPQTEYPPNTGISTSDKHEDDFRRQFVDALSEEIARHFYPHDSRANFAYDSKASFTD